VNALYELVFENKMCGTRGVLAKCWLMETVNFPVSKISLGINLYISIFEFSNKHLLSPVSGTELDNNRKCTQEFRMVALTERGMILLI